MDGNGRARRNWIRGNRQVWGVAGGWKRKNQSWKLWALEVVSLELDSNMQTCYSFAPEHLFK